MVQAGEKWLLSSTFQIHIGFFLTAALCLWVNFTWEPPVGGREARSSSFPPIHRPSHPPFSQAGSQPSISSTLGLNAASEEGLPWKRKIRLVTRFHTSNFSPWPWLTQRRPSSSLFLARLQAKTYRPVARPKHWKRPRRKIQVLITNPAFKCGYNTSLLKISKAALVLKRDLCWSLLLGGRNISPLKNYKFGEVLCFVFWTEMQCCKYQQFGKPDPIYLINLVPFRFFCTAAPILQTFIYADWYRTDF